jgi:hypothetical protein
MLGNLPGLAVNGWLPRYTVPSKKWTTPERVEITDCPKQGSVNALTTERRTTEEKRP